MHYCGGLFTQVNEAVRPRPGSCGRQGVHLFLGDAAAMYAKWPAPTVIVSDGPYGVSGFPGDLPTVEGLVEWYEPHVREWSVRALPCTTLWFWNTELGWATLHQMLTRHGWEFRNCHIWNKGLSHVAGNANSKTLRKFPVVTEVCVQYVRVVRLTAPDTEEPLALKEWLRHEWERSGLPLAKTNEAAGVLNAATRKYFTQDHLWYFPPAEAFQRLVDYANRHGRPAGRPYFSIDGRCPLTGDEWEGMRAKFRCSYGVNNVWAAPPMRSGERLKRDGKVLHMNQKPLSFMRLIVQASSDLGDAVWEPFGGLCTAAVACLELGRHCYASELNQDFYEIALSRLERIKLESARDGDVSVSGQPFVATRAETP